MAKKCSECKGSGCTGNVEEGWGQCPACKGYGYIRLEDGTDSSRTEGGTTRVRVEPGSRATSGHTS